MLEKDVCHRLVENIQQLQGNQVKQDRSEMSTAV